MNEISLPVKLKRKSKRGYPNVRNNYRIYRCASWNWLSIFRAIEKLKRKGLNSYLKPISEKYNIPINTLKEKYNEWVNNGKQNNTIIEDGRGIHNRSFTEEEERELYEYIRDLFINYNLFIDDECIQIMAKKKWDTKYPECNDAFKASNGWVYEFKKRWRISTRTASPSRIAINVDDNKLIEFYKTYDEAIDSISKEFIFNMDETFWRLITESLDVIGIVGSENRKFNLDVEHKKGFTTIFIISASGYFFNPMIIIKGKTERCLKKTGLIDDSLTYRRFSNNGWIDVDSIMFILNLIYIKTGGNRSLLILDEYSVHKLDSVKQKANDLNIQLLYIPPGRTSKNQPLDVSINGAIKSIGRRLQKEIFLTNPLGTPSIADAVKCMIDSKHKIKQETIINAFTRACVKSKPKNI